MFKIGINSRKTKEAWNFPSYQQAIDKILATFRVFQLCQINTQEGLSFFRHYPSLAIQVLSQTSQEKTTYYNL